MRCVATWQQVPARPARTTRWPRANDPRLVAAVQALGIEQPYVHQAAAIQASLAGEHVVMSTSTASGKTLAYNLPILDTLLNDPEACALYVFPTKALAHDQITNLKASVATLRAHSSASRSAIACRSRGSSIALSPAWWDSSWRTVTFSLPFCANSGQ